MQEIDALQQAYLAQFLARKSRAVFDDAGSILSGERWHLVAHEKVPKERALKCELPRESGRPCNMTIHNVYTIQSESGRLLHVGKNCLENVVTLSGLTKIEKEVDGLRQKIVSANREYAGAASTSLSAEEKAYIIEKAEAEGILPESIQRLLQDGVPLPNTVYNGLRTNLHNLEQNRKMLAERQQRQKEWEEKQEKEPERQRNWQAGTAVPTPAPSNKPPHVLYQERLAEAFADAGIAAIQTVGDAKKACEIGLMTYLEYAPQKARSVRRYSDVVRDIGGHFEFDPNRRKKFNDMTIEHAVVFLIMAGYKVFGEKPNDFLFR